MSVRAAWIAVGLRTVLLSALALPVLARAQDLICQFRDQLGVVRQATHPDQIPPALRAGAQCAPRGSFLADPSAIQLGSSVRRETISSPIGAVDMRWPRSVERLFGRSPERAVADAAQAVARTVRQGGFPIELQRLSLPWQVVFMDEQMPETQIPAYLVSNCHPAWMTPPANIYVVAQRVVAGCSRRTAASSVADAELAQVLLHEMGHAVEYSMLKGRVDLQDRMRAEGFAAWFEQYASAYSSVTSESAVRQMFVQLARQSLMTNPGFSSFQGSGADYARASMFFNAIVKKRGLSALSRVYEQIGTQGLGFFPAVERELGWNPARLHSEAIGVIN